MKNFYITVIIFVIIISGSILSHFYAKNYLNTIDSQIKIFSELTEYDNDEKSRIENIKKNFQNKKNMLKLIISKEHINNIELNIRLIENSVKNNDFETCQQKSIETQNIISQVESYLIAAD